MYKYKIIKLLNEKIDITSVKKALKASIKCSHISACTSWRLKIKNKI